ncbi:MAG: prepilin-type N-terminal cleavage/methylation domain-containing protein [Patescibacteria group bacterium]|nr:prepilin-type N-terminal cleavage/methylation domain-containing protein [Patescibacteria group bacterium]
MKISTQKLKLGFTLLEVIIAVFIFSMIAYGIIFLMSNILTSASGQTTILADTDQARKLAFRIASELRNATYGSDGGYPLNTAGDQQVVFYSNADTSDTNPERIRYFVQNGKLYEGITKWDGAAYDLAKEQTNAVQNNLGNGATPLFYYYDETYTGSSTQASLPQPVSILQVRHVKLNLQIFNVAGATRTQTYTITSSATMRNLKTNLGN